MTAGPITIGPATPADLPALIEMQARSMRVLGRDHYAPAVIEGFIAQVGTMDAVLIEDGTYHVARQGGRIVASGGWSLRRPGYARAAEDDPPAPKIRSIFVDPSQARRGLGRRIMAHVEALAAAAGHERAELAATLMGIPFYAALGYRPGLPLVLELGGGLRFVGLAMSKALALPRIPLAA